jgi:hypothetical protein
LFTQKEAVMARIFTTQFVFNHRSYDAIVTVLSKEGKFHFSVQLIDLDLHELIPNGVVNYEGSNGYEQLETLNNTLSQSLMRALTQAIESHLQVI